MKKVFGQELLEEVGNLPNAALFVTTLFGADPTGA